MPFRIRRHIVSPNSAVAMISSSKDFRPASHQDILLTTRDRGLVRWALRSPRNDRTRENNSDIPMKREGAKADHLNDDGTGRHTAAPASCIGRALLEDFRD